ncbi:MAG: FAD-dependent oxidoreductase [Candidatus Edwardsbacteria bacterium]|nr:FAD-dependent oxidoreductase [Candidatus Edwardsbacteria bacterium]
MPQISVTLNGKQVSCDSSQTILDVAQSQGVPIPTLCHDPALSPYGSCWVCLVSVKGARGFVPSCATKVADGMEIETESPAVVAARTMALGLLLSNHTGDCTGPCVSTCPANCDAQGYVALVANGMEAEAIRLIKETLPLPASLGRVCPHPCETECRRNLVEEPVAICSLKRHAADADLNSGKPYLPQCEPLSGKKVAVVGAGPAGLTAAYYLRQMGHAVAVFEALPKSGGWLRYGIPQYRLPKEVLDQEVRTITDLGGIEIKYGQRLGADITLDGLKQQYDAVFLGIGAHASSRMGVENEDDRGVVAGIDFLKRLAGGHVYDFARDGIKKVAVIGGGNTAIDAARTSLRLGAAEVTIVYRRSEQEMPANPLEIEEARHEGVRFQLLTAPTRVIACTPDGSGAISCQKMELGEPDASGRRRPVPVPGSDFHVEADLIIACIGQAPDLSGLGLGHGLKTTKWSTVETDPDTGATAVPGVFAAGDCVTGAATVVEAIGGARRAAAAIDAYLRTGKVAKAPRPYDHTRGKINEVPQDLFAGRAKEARTAMPMIPAGERVNFREVELGFPAAAAAGEARRCLECGCADMRECKLRDYAGRYDAAAKRYLGEVGKHPIDDSHPFLVRDQAKCVMCGRCVRMCLDVVGAAALGFVHRGFAAIVAPAMDRAYPETSCVSCGACIDTCPVGALTERVRRIKPSNWELSGTPTVCTYCGVGCGATVETKADRAIRVTGDGDSPVSAGGLCFKGKFGSEFLRAPERLLAPLVRRGAAHAPAGWSEALTTAGLELDAAVKKHGSAAVAVFASGRCTVEECEGLRSWAAQRGVTAFASFAHLAGRPLAAFQSVLGTSRGAGYDAIDSARTILLAGSDAYNEHPVLSRRIRAAARNGAKLYTLDEGVTKLGDIAARSLAAEPGTLALVLDAVLKQLLSTAKPATMDGSAELKKSLAKLTPALISRTGIKKPDIISLAAALAADPTALVIFNGDAVSAEATQALANILLALDRPQRFIALRAKANGAGVDRFVTAEASDMLKAIDRGAIKAAVLLNEDPVGSLPGGDKIAKTLARLETLLVCDLFLTPTAKLAGIVLPASAFAEHEGTFVNSEDRSQRLQPALKPAAGRTTAEVLKQLGGKPAASLPPEKSGKPRFAVPALKKDAKRARSFHGDALEKWVWELKKKEGMLKDGE